MHDEGTQRVYAINATTTHLTALEQQIRLLTVFHHRNKNQHRQSKWYRHLGILLRQERKLAHELDQLINWATSANTGIEELRTWLRRRQDESPGAHDNGQKKIKGKTLRAQVRECLEKDVCARLGLLGGTVLVHCYRYVACNTIFTTAHSSCAPPEFKADMSLTGHFLN